MKPIAPALIVSVLITCAVAGLASIDGGAENATAGDAQPVGTFCDTPSDPCWPGNLTPTPQVPEGGIDAMAIDMDPSNAPANTATSIGSREFCARINENDVLDADEDGVDTLEFDVTTGPQGIPEIAPMVAFNFRLRYHPAALFVASENQDFLITSLAGSGPLFTVSDELPDTDGVFLSTALDLASTGASSETGPGTLTRISVESLATADDGIHHLVIDDEEASHIDTLNIPHAPLVLNHAVVAIGTECPETQPEPTFPPGPTFTAGATTPAKTSPQTPFTPPPKESPIKPTNTPTPTPPGTPTPPQPTAPGPAGDSVTDTPTPAGLPSAGGEPRHARSEAVLSALALAIIGFAAAACWTALRAPKK